MLKFAKYDTNDNSQGKTIIFYNENFSHIISDLHENYTFFLKIQTSMTSKANFNISYRRQYLNLTLKFLYYLARDLSRTQTRFYYVQKVSLS